MVTTPLQSCRSNEVDAAQQEAQEGQEAHEAAQQEAKQDAEEAPHEAQACPDEDAQEAKEAQAPLPWASAWHTTQVRLRCTPGCLGCQALRCPQ